MESQDGWGRRIIAWCRDVLTLKQTAAVLGINLAFVGGVLWLSWEWYSGLPLPVRWLLGAGGFFLLLSGSMAAAERFWNGRVKGDGAVAPTLPRGVGALVERAASTSDGTWEEKLARASKFEAKMPFSIGSDFLLQCDLSLNDELVDTDGARFTFAVTQEHRRVIDGKAATFGEDPGHVICPVTAEESSGMRQGPALLGVAGILANGQRVNYGPMRFEVLDPPSSRAPHEPA